MAEASQSGSSQAISASIELNHGGKPMPMIGIGTDVFRDPAIVESAIRDAGYRHIDTASHYGSEETVGQGIANCIA